MQKELEDLGITAPKDHKFKNDDLPSAFDGGLAIVVDEEVVSEPGCCCDLTEWLELRSQAQARNPEWSEVWNGHDGTSVQVQYRAATDSFDIRVGPYDSGEWDIEVEVSARLLEDSLAMGGRLSTHIAPFEP